MNIVKLYTLPQRHQYSKAFHVIIHIGIRKYLHLYLKHIMGLIWNTVGACLVVHCGPTVVARFDSKLAMQVLEKFSHPFAVISEEVG